MGSEAQARVRPACSRRNTPFDLLEDETEPPGDQD